MYEYRCKILRVVDGDTVDVDIDLGFGVWMHKERVRINGIDTPESRTRDKEEKVFEILQDNTATKNNTLHLLQLSLKAVDYWLIREKMGYLPVDYDGADFL